MIIRSLFPTPPCWFTYSPTPPSNPPILDGYLRQAVEVSFNRISVDGDTSTNDTVLLLASGASGATVGADNAEFAAALTQVCTSLARQIVADGEGITHVVELHIDGAATDADALTIAKAIAHSPLVKTAWAGNDPNWGRLMAAIGYSGAKSTPTASTSVSATCRSAATADALRSSMRPPRTPTLRSVSSPSPFNSTRAQARASSGPPTSPSSTSTSTPTIPANVEFGLLANREPVDIYAVISCVTELDGVIALLQIYLNPREPITGP